MSMLDFPHALRNEGARPTLACCMEKGMKIERHRKKPSWSEDS